MSLWHAFFVVMAVAGVASIAGLVIDFIRFHRSHRYMRISRPLPDDRRWIEEFKRSLHR